MPLMNDFVCTPIGYFHAEQQDRYALPRQPDNLVKNAGRIVLNSGCNFEQALQGLEDFDRIWVIFRFHRNTHWKPKVMPPRGGKKQGVLATRSPHRPNFLGISCIELRQVQGLELTVANHDLLDGTPILDIKPYINYADSHVSQRQGWIEELEQHLGFSCVWSELAEMQLSFLQNGWNIIIKDAVELRLETSPFPYPNNRINAIDNGESDTYVLGYKSWRVLYHVDILEKKIGIRKIFSGYDQESLSGRKGSRWGDLEAHRAFVNNY